MYLAKSGTTRIESRPCPHTGDMDSDAITADFQQDSMRKAELDLLR